MRQQKEVTIDGHKYVIGQFSATKGSKLLVRLVKILGQPLGLMVGDINPNGNILDMKIDGKLIGEALQALAFQLDEKQFVDTMKELFDGTYRDGAPIVFDIDFAGRYGHMFMVAGAVLEAQYGDFLGVVAGLQNRLPRRQAATESRVPETLAGQFGVAS